MGRWLSGGAEPSPDHNDAPLPLATPPLSYSTLNKLTYKLAAKPAGEGGASAAPTPAPGPTATPASAGTVARGQEAAVTFVLAGAALALLL